ncbi:hypothetical protein [Microlunatus sp. Gsoil 973]|uniref:hypothetical protein n=1 Tax=Microlunatus sp. Gsoil 973 TaxID=2672569 RepID=UPI0012B47567|nr:hypothetical protein [Microlunatus sp. Gsoil 973]QGN32605.1 hypothetical protein GJV80_07060 [Microlunatus sp. Gsoil 973]
MTSSRTSPLPRVITVCKLKLGGGRGCWQAYEIASDADGRWLYTPAGSIFRSSDGEIDTRCEVEGGDGPGLDCLTLVPGPAAHWLATWSVPQRPLHIGVEVCDLIRRATPDVVAFLDWELDPFRLRSGLVAVEDLDDFADVRAAGLLTDDDADQALQAAAWVERRLRQQIEPFDGRGDRRLFEAGQLDLPSLVDVPHPFDV